MNEGGTLAFYRGLTPNLIGNSCSWAVYFMFYSMLQDSLLKLRIQNDAVIFHENHGQSRNRDALVVKAKSSSKQNHLSSLDYFLASGLSGIFTSIITNPIWVVKTRMLSTGSAHPGAYPSFVSGIRIIHKTEGIKGFYRGIVPALFNVSHGALQFMAYERLKKWLSAARQGSKEALGKDVAVIEIGQQQQDQRRDGHHHRHLHNINTDYFISSTLSKTFAATVTYPLQLVRARLQTYDEAVPNQARERNTKPGQSTRALTPTLQQPLVHVVRQTWHREGIRGFYKGLAPNILRVLPSTWVTFLAYENMRAYLLSR